MTLSSLILRVEEGEGADRELDARISQATGWRDDERYTDGGTASMAFLLEHKCPSAKAYIADRMGIPPYTASLDAVVSLIEQKLPGFWWRGGTCSVSSEARVCPDHNDPVHGSRLLIECPPSVEHWNEGIEVELRHGSQNALVRALLAACLRALSALEEKADG